MTPAEQDDDRGDRTMFVTRDHIANALASAAPLVHYLVVVEGSSPGARVEIGAEPVTVGRGAQQTLVCDDREVSRLHLRVSLVGNAVVAEDLSSYGTFVDGERINGTALLKEGNLLRLGAQTLKYERRTRADVRKEQELARDIKKASDYVHSLLPAPLVSGPVRSEWCFVPSAQLGGDAFGYDWVDPDTFVFYLMDVSGHGVGSAMHSVSVLNVLRQRALPNVDFLDPPQVLASLNDRFQRSDHNGLYFTMWYGIYRPKERVLTYGTAGHGPAILVDSGKRETLQLGMPALMIGMLPDQAYEAAHTTVPPGSTLYVFSDGAYEIATKDDDRWDLDQFLPLLTAPALAGTTEPNRIYQAIKQAAKPGPLEDDCSIVAFTFA